MDLAKLRDEYELSQEQAGRRVGFGQSAWSRWESGAAAPPPLVLWCLQQPELRRALLEKKALLLKRGLGA